MERSIRKNSGKILMSYAKPRMPSSLASSWVVYRSYPIQYGGGVMIFPVFLLRNINVPTVALPSCMPSADDISHSLPIPGNLSNGMYIMQHAAMSTFLKLSMFIKKYCNSVALSMVYFTDAQSWVGKLTNSPEL